MNADPTDRFLEEVENELDLAQKEYWAAGLSYVPRQVWDARCEALELLRRVVVEVSDAYGR